ncbi:hypothetical protein L596_026522 [Steinernema carpocapsae]|uniref:G-protein coupled receptors family 1 profile domain-containing protein n=1 Tax=Steinernema carpocapsae TaxID=34508 RepID=A0A4U5M1L3_STECR|nr:hypothetical protein L596_026522 [Steinernema carpocapsae]
MSNKSSIDPQFDRSYSDKERITFGSIYMGLVVVSIPTYGLILWIFVTRRHFRQNPCYQIMSAIGVCDFVYLIGQFGIGLRVVANVDFPKNVERVSSSLPNKLFKTILPIVYSMPNAGFNGSILLILVLSLNRFFVLTNFARPPPFVYHVLIALCWLVMIFIFLLFVIPGDGIGYEPAFMLTVLHRNVGQTYVDVFFNYSVVISFVVFVTSLGLYSVITIYLIVRRKQLSSVNSSLNTYYTREIKILIQGVLTFLCGEFININTMFGRAIFPKSYMYTGSFNAFLIFHSGLFYPIVYLSLNSELRKEIKKRIFKTWMNKGSAVSVAHVSSVQPVSTIAVSKSHFQTH